MIIRAKAPLRLGFAGGGTDVSPYCDLYGGNVLNACISLYAYASIIPRNDAKAVFISADRGEKIEVGTAKQLPYNGTLDLIKAVYNRIVRDYNLDPLAFEITTYVDAPAGSGLGSSSTLVVAVLKAFTEWQRLPLTEYDIAKLAWSIEREDMQLAGGLQDQYAAAFGGFNFMEFNNNQKVVVNPLRIKPYIENELQFNTLLYYTGTSRLSAEIIKSQINNINSKSEKTLESMHNLKKNAFAMKEALVTGRIDEMGEILNEGWLNKKKTSSSISNPVIDQIYETALKAGATGGKISGAGGGGFFMFYCPRNTRYKVIESLSSFGGEFRRFSFVNEGAESWVM
jgi:D-glycero-alpha-D-manno-heptose-7-phosphate kinase